jgi:hypothetical protein
MVFEIIKFGKLRVWILLSHDYTFTEMSPAGGDRVGKAF